MLDQFKELYVHDCINGDGMSEELNQLFEKILLEEFNDDHTKMDELIQSIVDENTPKEPDEIDKLKVENERLNDELTSTQMALTDVYEILLGG